MELLLHCIGKYILKVSMKPVYIDKNHYRFENYDTLINLYEGKAFEVWGIGKRDYYKHLHKDNPLSYINYNFIKLYTEKISEIVLGKNFNVTTGNIKRDDFLNDWIEQNHYVNLQYQKLLYGNFLGDSITKMYTKGGKVKTEYIAPNHWFPITNKYNINIIDGHALVFEYKNEDKKLYYLVEEYYTGYNIYRAYDHQWDQQAIDDLFPDLFDDGNYEFQRIVETSVRLPLVTRYKNSDTYNDPFGSGDFDEASLSIMYNINDAISGIHATNNETRNPLYSLPPGTIQNILDKAKNGRAKNTGGSVKAMNPYMQFSEDINNAVNNKGLGQQMEVLMAQEYLSQLLNKTRAIEKSTDGQSIEVVEHNPIMENSFKEVEQLEAFLYQVMSLSPVLIDSKFRAGALSGVALRNLANATIKKANRKAKELIRSIKEEMILIQELSGLEPLPVTVEISDGLATEPQDDIDWITRAFEIGLISQEDAIAILRDLSISEATKKAKDLDIKPQPINDNPARIFDAAKR
jgi:hypothetical protein